MSMRTVIHASFACSSRCLYATADQHKPGKCDATYRSMIAEIPSRESASPETIRRPLRPAKSFAADVLPAQTAHESRGLEREHGSSSGALSGLEKCWLATGRLMADY